MTCNSVKISKPQEISHLVNLLSNDYFSSEPEKKLTFCITYRSALPKFFTESAVLWRRASIKVNITGYLAKTLYNLQRKIKAIFSASLSAVGSRDTKTNSVLDFFCKCSA